MMTLGRSGVVHYWVKGYSQDALQDTRSCSRQLIWPCSYSRELADVLQLSQMMQLMPRQQVDDPVHGDDPVLGMRHPDFAVGVGESFEQCGIESRQRHEQVDCVLSAETVLARHPAILIERLSGVVLGRQRHARARAEGHLGLSEVRQNLSRR